MKTEAEAKPTNVDDLEIASPSNTATLADPDFDDELLK
jgi:hypothetical protein